MQTHTSVTLCAMCILRCLYIKNPLEILICCFMFLLHLLLTYMLIKQAPERQEVSFPIVLKPLFPDSAAKDEDEGKCAGK